MCESLTVPDYHLEEWVAVLTGRLEQPSPEYLVVMFPTDELRDEYLRAVEDRPDEEVRSILRQFLGGSRTVELIDRMHVESLRAWKKFVEDSSSSSELEFGLSEYDRRVIRHFGGLSTQPTWEGLTWVIDLLPHFPQQALDVVHAYTTAHAQVLPDLRLSGLSDAADLIRARFVTQGAATTEVLTEILLNLAPRDMEFLVGALYRALGYDVVVTPAQKDGGKDVVATKPNEVVYVECKNWRGRVDSDVIAALVGRVETHRVTRGVVIATSGFTRGPASATDVAAESAARISLVSGEDLITQLNRHLGSRWHQRLERILQAERSEQAVN